jgi:hypothetical protein
LRSCTIYSLKDVEEELIIRGDSHEELEKQLAALNL